MLSVSPLLTRGLLHFRFQFYTRTVYPRSKFQEILLEIRQEMARDADFDVDLFVEIVRTGTGPKDPKMHAMQQASESSVKNGRADKR